MISFILAGAALVAAALSLLLRPWWRRNRRIASADSHSSLNVAIHRDRLAELDRDHRNGTLSASGLAEAREELQRQLLEDTEAAEVVIAGTGDKRTGIAIAVLLPLLASGLYFLLGTPTAVLPAAERVQRASADMEQLTIRLAQKLEQSPDNPEGWAMLARSYKSLGRWDDAEKAFGKIGTTLDRNAELLAEYAEMLVQRDNGFGQRSRELTRKALEVEPRNMLALFLGGGEAFDGGRYNDAIRYWELLLPQLEGGSEDAQMVEASIARARQAGGGKPLAAAPQDEMHRAAAGKAPGTAQSAVTGRVELAPALKAKAAPEDVVFVFARAIDGPRMPLAALRAKAADLPLDFTLDDSRALSAESKISSASQLRVEVRVSKSGNAMPGPGDLTGRSAPVKPGAKDLRIVVDQISP